MARADVEIADGGYVLRTALMVAAPVDAVRQVLADQGRLAEWMPQAEPVEGPAGEGEVRFDVGIHGGARHLGRTTVEPDGTVVRRWTLLVPPARGAPDEPAWRREVRYGTRMVQGGTHVDVEVVTTVVGAPARTLRGGAKAEARGLEDAMARLARLAEGRRTPVRGGRPAGPL